MTVSELSEKNVFEAINISDPDREIGTPFCCDLLSIAMGKAPAGCSWVTVMSNINTLAVATLADAALVVLAEGARPDESVTAKAAEQGVNLFATPLPVFEAALKIHELI